ncbi:Sec-independent protein translocase protein TatB [Paracoccaceae bacterium]|nr:Sec-independent protein translocase protein TatB [Paracoccaceae bacterium]
MFDLGWQELLVIATVALIVVGPKDLPKLFNKAGKFIGKLKKISGDFYKQLNEVAEIEEIKNFKSDLNHFTDIDDLNDDNQKILKTKAVDNKVLKNKKITKTKGNRR